MTKTLPISKVREELPTLVDRAQRLLEEVVITVNGKPTAILMSIDEFESWKETMEILADKELMEAIREGEEDIKAGRVVDFDKLVKELDV